MDEIDKLRTRIDDIDQNILELLHKRQENAKQLGLLKQARNRKIRDPARERKILQRVQTAARERNLNSTRVRNIFREIFQMSIDAQFNLRVSNGALRGKSVLVIGGSGGMGRLFARFTRASGATVRITGRNIRKTRTAAREMGVTPGTVQDAANSDIVIVAVPLDAISQVSADAAARMRPGTLLTDLSSVKSTISDKIFSSVPESVEYASIHPLFGPNVDSIAGQIIAVVSYHIGSQWRSFSRAIHHHGASTHSVTADEHDMTMARVQALHHFALVCFAKSLEDWDGELSTNSIRNTLRTVRGLLENWNTVAGIQHLNPYAKNKRLDFVRVAKNMSTWASGPDDVKNLSSHVQEWTRKP